MKSDVKYLLLVALFLTLLLPSCTKKEYEPGLKGSLVGYVVTFDEYSKPLSDHSRVMALAIGKDEVFRTFTDQNGRFEFENLPTGTYELHLEKQGYGALKQFGIQHLGGEPTILNISTSSFAAYFLFQKSTAEITYLKIENDSIFCQCKFVKDAPDNIYFQLSTSLEANFDRSNTIYLIPYLRLIKSGDFYTAPLYYVKDFFTAPGLPYVSGETIYYRACICPNYGVGFYRNHISSYGIDTYFDYDKNFIIYPGLGKESEEFIYVMP